MWLCVTSRRGTRRNVVAAVARGDRSPQPTGLSEWRARFPCDHEPPWGQVAHHIHHRGPGERRGRALLPRKARMNLTQGLHRAVQQDPDGIATICAGRTRTHAESVDRIARLAAGLTYCGVEDGERAAILSLNSDRHHEFLAATLWAGGVVVPVNLRWSIPEIAESLSEVDARVLVVDDAFAGHVAGIREQHPRLEQVIHAGDGPTPDGMTSFDQLIEGSTPIEDA